MEKEHVDFDLCKASKLADELRKFAVADCNPDQNQKRSVCEVKVANTLDRTIKHLEFWLTKYKEHHAEMQMVIEILKQKMLWNERHEELFLEIKARDKIIAELEDKLEHGGVVKCEQCKFEKECLSEIVTDADSGTNIKYCSLGERRSDAIEGMCCDCKYDRVGFYGDSRENVNCERQGENCWKSYKE